MKIAIHHGGKYGFVHYNKGDRKVMVTHPDERVRNTVRHYLNNERTIIVARNNNPNEVGNRLPIRVVPNEDIDTMLMSLSEMYHNTGVHVNWGHEENDLGGNVSVQDNGDPNAKADKPIIKSLFGDEDYEIIN